MAASIPPAAFVNLAICFDAAGKQATPDTLQKSSASLDQICLALDDPYPRVARGRCCSTPSGKVGPLTMGINNPVGAS